ncbi:MAG: hypothetical protein U1E06_18080 [Tabrizicola sp.]|uniref:hypothetical protein n=1 Tax=Tabrizicola sp. TaxID=2005166 RepID=UPI002734D1A5|nr:hypothetical protein [Tabrizicola sp.]MDP3262815.1 hypothetical protein [Tabrizicola sp.]MDP3649012.1 hypothetical protein [Paracoccaceae bacterium]MDZ4068714.1 hypothetical protein [Tabrizicola sp.]
MMKSGLLCGLVLLSGCGMLQGKGPATATPAAVEIAPAVTTSALGALGAQGASAAALDTTTAAEKAAALAAPAATGERELGRVTVALGPPAEQGIWLRTGLVSEAVMGRVLTAAGKSLALELRPGSGAALLSLAAFQALGLGLTELPQVTVFAP